MLFHVQNIRTADNQMQKIVKASRLSLIYGMLFLENTASIIYGLNSVSTNVRYEYTDIHSGITQPAEKITINISLKILNLQSPKPHNK